MKAVEFNEMPHDDCICEYKNCKQIASQYVDFDKNDEEGNPFYKRMCYGHALRLVTSY